MTPVADASRLRSGSGAPASGSLTDLARRYRNVRAATEALCEPLKVEDHVVQTMENVSPTKWHLAHVSWFFETFLLREHLPGYEPVDDRYAYLFNSYYVQAGERHCRDSRGWISRPTVAEVHAYREHVDEGMLRLLERVGEDRVADGAEIASRAEIGLHHEQQHQELLLTDIKHVFGVNPLRPAYREVAAPQGGTAPPLEWVAYEGGLVEVGHRGDGFSYDNERPRHRHYLEDFRLASRPVTCGEWLDFIGDGGYERPELWLSDGWAAVRENGWTEPFYWERGDDGWEVHTLGGRRELRPEEPVCHVTYLEADAFARWASCRLPTEAEWEVAARREPLTGNLVETEALHPAAPGAVEPVGGGGPAGGEPGSVDVGAPFADASPGGGEKDVERGGGSLHQVWGDVWEWTRSQYEPYPGYELPAGALGEYNGKFMCDQFVLRGGSCATPRTHIRPTYRNFFHADEAWQFTGLRLARDA